MRQEDEEQAWLEETPSPGKNETQSLMLKIESLER